ncbi:MAG: septal ring lytic transglycosylase RlpA family protein [Thermoanaerobaculia bacterium]|nr:septal ring lytic transglycosylase RlpA family protein [Thermoanaerobaculia bacterium]
MHRFHVKTRTPKWLHGHPSRAFVLALLATLFTGCSMHRYDKPRVGTTQRGVASWYGEPFHGRKTASGEVYDMHEMTAAHKELPLGTVVHVKNLDNGREAQFRVNDRGPFIRGRVLDVSYAGAKELGMVGPGTARIELRVIQLGGGPSGQKLTTRFAVQVGAFSERQNAIELHRKLANDYPDAELIEDGRWHRVRIGSLRTEKEARKLERDLQKRGLPAVVIRLN